MTILKSRILLVEDEENIREIISDYFTNEGYSIREAEDGQAAIELYEETSFDLVILDIMLPKLDGWSVCRRIRKLSDVPIIMLTARTDEEDQLMGFELGADEYVTKPFSPKVLVARAKILLKRSENEPIKENDILIVNGIAINQSTRIVEIGGESLELTYKEFELLLYMVKNKNIVLSRETLLKNVWEYDYYGDLRTVDTHIKRLRSKLGSKAKCISTVIRAGYKFEVFS